MKKRIVFFVLLSGIFLLEGFVNVDKREINWITPAELSVAYAQNPKPIFIDLYTDWCGWCKRMDRTTFRNEKLINYVNENFYAIKFNAESTEPITFAGKTYQYDSAWRVHEFAVFVSRRNLEFPQTIFLSDLKATPAPLIGYRKASEMEAPIKYFGERANLTQSFEAFSKTFKKKW